MKKGSHHTPETRAKISAAQTGRMSSPETRAKLRKANLGKTLSPETRAKVSRSLKGYKQSPEHIAKRVAYWTGRKHTPEAYVNMRAAQAHQPRGSASPFWRGGASPYGPGFTEDLKRIVRWLYDDRCARCDTLAGEIGPRELDVHHVDYDKQNNTLDNLVPLCASCHAMTGARRDYWQRFFGNRPDVLGGGLCGRSANVRTV